MIEAKKEHGRVWVDGKDVYVVIFHHPTRTYVTLDRGYVQNPGLSRSFSDMLEFAQHNNAEYELNFYQAYLGGHENPVSADYDTYWMY